ncbi:MAG TPA: type II toxin-antitoxin system ParD family antitoxin [Xanthobacteraceae bacterium]|nr:type II toxin-antitoxin system ParD family antitoxin [Xanthobacteraceae bacterium]
MPTRNISLTPEQDAFIDEMLKKGEYANASEAVRDAIRALQRRCALRGNISTTSMRRRR